MALSVSCAGAGSAFGAEAAGMRKVVRVWEREGVWVSRRRGIRLKMQEALFEAAVATCEVCYKK